MSTVINWFRKAWLVLVVAGIVILLDQWTKTVIRVSVPEYTAISPIPALGEYFLFEHVRNYGAAFGILQNQGGFFIVIAIVVAVAILFYVRYLPTDQWVVRVLLGLQLGGAIGNVIDRFQQGYVTDFVKIGIPGVYYWPNFNVADSAIVIGVVGLGIYILVEDVRKQRHEKASAATRASDLPAATTDPNHSES
jgi:signal peptidase II